MLFLMLLLLCKHLILSRSGLVVVPIGVQEFRILHPEQQRVASYAKHKAMYDKPLPEVY